MERKKYTIINSTYMKASNKNTQNTQKRMYHPRLCWYQIFYIYKHNIYGKFKYKMSFLNWELLLSYGVGDKHMNTFTELLT